MIFEILSLSLDFFFFFNQTNLEDKMEQNIVFLEKKTHF